MSATSKWTPGEPLQQLIDGLHAYDFDDWGCHEAAWLLAEWEAIRQTVNCPTCDGTQLIAETTPSGGNTNWECEDCTDDHPSMARLLTVGAAVFNAATSESGQSVNVGEAWPHFALGLLAHLRAVKP